jgi:hypothetical protein
MTEKYDNMSLDELQKLKEERQKAKIKAELESEDKKAREEEEQRKLNEQKALWEEEFYKSHPELAPKSKLTDEGKEKKLTNDIPNHVKYYQNYCERNEDLKTRSNYDAKLSDVKKERFQVYKNQRWQETSIDELFTNTDADSGCEDDVSDWSPADNYAKVIWETAVCKADLFKIAVKGISINPGQGLGVQIRAYGAFGDPTSLDACSCASCASISFSTYSLTLKQYNLEAIICDKDIWDVGSVLMDSYIKSMGDSWARWFDEQIYSELESATPGTDTELATALACSPSLDGSCCSDIALLELYNAVQTTVASMREGTGLAGPYNPDYLIISPSVAAIFKRMSTPQPMPWMRDVVFDESGRLKKIGGLNVIEYCGANACTDATGEAVAVIIDSSRAVGAVFGQRPKTYKFFQTNCNSYRIDQWAYFACGELDTDAIAHITNP